MNGQLSSNNFVSDFVSTRAKQVSKKENKNETFQALNFTTNIMKKILDYERLVEKP